MKKAILSILLVTGLALTSVAQGEKAPGVKAGKMKNASPEDRAKHHTEVAEKRLGLSADQKAKWEAASLESMKANAIIHEKLQGSTTPDERKALRAESKSNMQKFDKEVSAFLTGEQKTKWEEMKAERKQKMKEHRHKEESDTPN